MKVLFLSEYFYPIYFGGSEVSTELFAKYLSKKCEVIVACPRFDNSARTEEKDGYKIFRYPFPKHIVRHKGLSQFWHNSLILSLWRAFWIIKIAFREKIDIIHTQEKYLLIAGLITKLFTNKKLIITVRDYQLLCPLGFCLIKKREYKRCDLKEFFKEDIPYYFNNYLSRYRSQPVPTAKKVFSIIFLLRARFVAWIYRFCLNFCDEIVFISRKQKNIYEVNGMNKGKVIYNIADFDENKISKNITKDIDILFIGKPSIGKGIKLFSEIQREIEKRKLHYKIQIAGGNNFVSPSDLPKIYQKAKLTIVPSYWEEPFGRVALESLANGTPVLTTDKGGLPEIVENKVTGIISNENVEDMILNIKSILENEKKFEENIKSDYKKLKDKFLYEPLNQYLALYYTLCDSRASGNQDHNESSLFFTIGRKFKISCPFWTG